MILFGLGLLMTFTAVARRTDDATVLRIDSVRFDGNCMDMMTQHIVIYGVNTSNDDFDGFVYLLNNQGNGEFKSVYACELKAGAGSYLSEVLGFELHQGSYDLQLAADRDGKTLLGPSFQITIGEERPIDFEVEFLPEMMTTSDGINVLTSHQLRGKVKVTNNDDVPYYGISPVMSHGYGVMYNFVGEDVEPLASMVLGFLTNEVGAHESVCCDFGVDYNFQEGKTYSVRVLYTRPHSSTKIGEMTFTFHAGTNTYWTKNGEVKPVPIEADQRLAVPAEAVAVDLRGQYYMNTIFTVDASQANPNCLYYLDFLDNVPQGLNDQCNVVRDGQASIIRLTDNYDFYCPQTFKAKFISYTLMPNTQSGAYAETLVLPFHPQGASIDHINFPNDNLLKVFEYDGYDSVSDTLDIREIDVSQMQANKPYIVAVGVHSPVTFYAEDTTVPVTTKAVKQVGKLDFVGGTVFQAPSGGIPFRYEPEDGFFALQTSNDLLPPFRAWFNVRISDGKESVSGADGKDHGEAPGPAATGGDVYYYLRMNTGFDIGVKSQGVAIPKDTVATSSAVYSLCGKIVNSKLSNSKLSNSKLSKGVYIVGGKKLIVR
jgi:hypothetical protein